MSTNSIQQIRCPQCSQMSELTVWDSINVSEDPDLKNELLSGKINMFRCPSCGHTGLMPTPLVYRDDDKRFILSFIPCMNKEDKAAKFEELKKTSEESGDIRDIFGYKFRFVSDYNSLLEKILIFDANVLDKTIEVIKLLVMAQNPDKIQSCICRFGKLTEDKIEFLIQDVKNGQLYTSTVPKATYDSIDKQVQISGIKPYSFDWELIDADYAAKVFNGLNNQRR